MRKRETPGCSCHMCRLGKHTKAGHYITNQVMRRLRRMYRKLLRNYPAPGGDIDQVIISTPYTD